MLPDLFKDEKRRDMLRREVRAAREVVSPNVCRIFDLIEIDGRELVSMEYVDGGTLLGVLQERGPSTSRRPRTSPRSSWRAGSDPPGGSGPPRHQARKHHAHPGGPSGGDGLRARPPGHRGRRLGVGHTRLHGAGAGGGTDAGCARPTSTPQVSSSPRWSARRHQELRVAGRACGRACAPSPQSCPTARGRRCSRRRWPRTATSASTRPTP